MNVDNGRVPTKTTGPGQVEIEISILAETIGVTENLKAQLSNRLAGVLSEPVPQDAKPEPSVDKAIVPIADNIRANRKSLRSINADIEDILDRIQI